MPEPIVISLHMLFSRAASRNRHGKLLVHALQQTPGVLSVSGIEPDYPNLNALDLAVTVDPNCYWAVYGLLADWAAVVPGRSGFGWRLSASARERQLPYPA